ncbi:MULTISPECIES: hypothetical protein [unclassified Kitasatospora]
MSASTSVRNSALATACCALLLAVPLALARPAGAADNGPKTPEEAAACHQVIGALLGGFGPMLANAACTVRPAGRG